MVHISEITHAYVNDIHDHTRYLRVIHDHLTEGQDVKVMVIGLDNGKINLSIRRIQPAPPRQPADRRGQGERPRSDTVPLVPGPAHLPNGSRSPLTICSSSLWPILTARSPASSSIPTARPRTAAGKPEALCPTAWLSRLGIPYDRKPPCSRVGFSDSVRRLQLGNAGAFWRRRLLFWRILVY